VTKGSASGVPEPNNAIGPQLWAEPFVPLQPALLDVLRLAPLGDGNRRCGVAKIVDAVAHILPVMGGHFLSAGTVRELILSDRGHTDGL